MKFPGKKTGTILSAGFSYFPYVLRELQLYNFCFMIYFRQKFIQKICCFHFQMVCIDSGITAEPFSLCHFFVHDQLYIFILVVYKSHNRRRSGLCSQMFFHQFSGREGKPSNPQLFPSAAVSSCFLAGITTRKKLVFF